jgi:hypothetical protein
MKLNGKTMKQNEFVPPKEGEVIALGGFRNMFIVAGERCLTSIF